MPKKLGVVLKRLRVIKGFSLRDVEKRTNVSNAYLCQIESGKVKNPSPHHLHKLAAVYEVPYEELMKAAGYLVASEGEERSFRTIEGIALSSLEDLSEEEVDELKNFLAYLRSKRKK